MAELNKSKLKFENAGKKNDEQFKDEVDWLHYTVIHHIDHATPDVTTSQGRYYEVTRDDFETVVSECRDLLPKLSISSDNKGIFDEKVRNHAVPFGLSLKETRILHKKHNVGLRTDAEMLLDDAERYIERLKASRENLQSQLDTLKAKT